MDEFEIEKIELKSEILNLIYDSGNKWLTNKIIFLKYSWEHCLWS